MKLYGLDTNPLVRLLVNDDEKQHSAALEFAAGLGRDYNAFVSLLTIVKLDWALRSRLGFKRQDTVKAVELLLRSRGVVFEHHAVVVKALRLVADENLDLADALIAVRAIEAGCIAIKTFDRKAAARVPGMELLA